VGGVDHLLLGWEINGREGGCLLNFSRLSSSNLEGGNFFAFLLFLSFFFAMASLLIFMYVSFIYLNVSRLYYLEFLAKQKNLK
jgi:hypothetical protein